MKMTPFDLTWMLLKQGKVGPIDHQTSPFPMGQTPMQGKYNVQRIITKLMSGEELTPEEVRILDNPFGESDDYGPMIRDID
jgi:hypothetical protein